ncbi:hypothetical protein EOI86_23465 [Hwanghaeella grinnelliae]|uniref:VPLPA-CTERM sorting domain-containing protein n=1 Tax=Hwanghaeella grinnelliae TaxID=2500179 RepID=A0A437QHP6_9PROT|nr:hypothetical protein [Hwanghaeella grinnelliae]RVU34078.1 hypothetical protein EOI86_23465 [Hwanghaeella grinnelliae]
MLKSAIAGLAMTGLAITGLGAGTAEAATVGFGDTELFGVSSYSEGGFTFERFSGDQIVKAPNDPNNTGNFNGFDSVLLELDIEQGAAETRITFNGGAAFSFLSVLASQSQALNPLIFTGVFADTTTIVSEVFASNAPLVPAATLNFTGFTNIVELRVATNGNTFGLFDNFVFEEGVQAVPVPMALPLLASALAGLGLFGFRKRRRA